MLGTLVCINIFQVGIVSKQFGKEECKVLAFWKGPSLADWLCLLRAKDRLRLSCLIKLQGNWVYPNNMNLRSALHSSLPLTLYF